MRRASARAASSRPSRTHTRICAPLPGFEDLRINVSTGRGRPLAGHRRDDVVDGRRPGRVRGDAARDPRPDQPAPGRGSSRAPRRRSTCRSCATRRTRRCATAWARRRVPVRRAAGRRLRRGCGAQPVRQRGFRARVAGSSCAIDLGPFLDTLSRSRGATFRLRGNHPAAGRRIHHDPGQPGRLGRPQPHLLPGRRSRA